MTMWDSVTASDIPSSAGIVAGYLNGQYAWSAEDWARFPTAQHVGIVIYIPGRIPPNAGEVLDIEAGDAAGSVDTASRWVDARIAAGIEPVIYTSASTARYFTHLPCKLWLAEYTGEPHMCPGENVVATQYASPSFGSGGHWDLSVVVDDWPTCPPQIPPPPPAPTTTEYEDGMYKRIDIRVQGNGAKGPVGLDEQGHGSSLIDTPAGTVINAFPNTAGYVDVPEFVGVQDDNGKDRVFWKGSPNFPPFDAHVWVTSG